VAYVALATATTIRKQDFDEAPLVAALADAGVSTRVLAWDDPAAQPGFAGAVACVLRSTWNYVPRYAEFLPWIDRCAAATTLWNPAPIVRWNSHKKYLLELEAKGIPIVPTRYVPAGAAAPLAELIGDWDRVVVKPAVSAGSLGTIRVGRDDLATGDAHLAGLSPTRDMLVQRYEPAVEGYGERSLIWIDGAFTHAIRKNPRFASDTEYVSEQAVPIAADERALAEVVLAAVPRPLLYARVDLIRDPRDQPRLMELELIEPSLFFTQHPPAAARMATAIARLVAV
jgi:glutathione synthase/RimK-type ligase-like ATP-grasp enzyme